MRCGAVRCGAVRCGMVRHRVLFITGSMGTIAPYNGWAAPPVINVWAQKCTGNSVTPTVAARLYLLLAVEISIDRSFRRIVLHLCTQRRRIPIALSVTCMIRYSSSASHTCQQQNRRHRHDSQADGTVYPTTLFDTILVSHLCVRWRAPDHFFDAIAEGHFFVR